MVYRIPGYAFGGLPNFTWGGARHCGSVECSSGGHTRPLRAAISLAATAGKFGWVEGMPTPDRVPWKCNSGSAACTSRVLPGPQNAIPRRISAWGGHLRKPFNTPHVSLFIRIIIQASMHQIIHSFTYPLSIHSSTPSFIHPHLSIHSYFPCVAVNQSVSHHSMHTCTCLFRAAFSRLASPLANCAAAASLLWKP